MRVNYSPESSKFELDIDFYKKTTFYCFKISGERNPKVLYQGYDNTLNIAKETLKKHFSKSDKKWARLYQAIDFFVVENDNSIVRKISVKRKGSHSKRHYIMKVGSRSIWGYSDSKEEAIEKAKRNKNMFLKKGDILVLLIPCR